MKKVVLDTSVLISFWRQRRAAALVNNSAKQAESWGRDLVRLHDTDAIVTPVYIEMVAGTMNRHELSLTKAYLKTFRCIDQGNILSRDWQEAIRVAQRIGRQPLRRDLGDCIIRAIADRLHHEVF